MKYVRAQKHYEKGSPGVILLFVFRSVKMSISRDMTIYKNQWKLMKINENQSKWM